MEAAWDSRVQCLVEDVVAKVDNADIFSNENEVTLSYASRSVMDKLLR
jgi:hypothetical protein